MKRLARTIEILALIFGLLTAVSCRRAAPERETRLEVRLQGGAGHGLTLYEMRANVGTVIVETLRLDKTGAGVFRFATDSLSLYVLQAEPISDTRAADGPDSRRRSRRDNRGDEPQSRREATDGESAMTDATAGLDNRLVLFPTAGDRLQLTADYTDLLATAHLTDAHGHTLDSLHILPFQRAQQATERLNREATDYWLSVRYADNAKQIYDSIIQVLDRNYRTQKTESLRLATLYPETLIPIYLAQLPVGNRPLFDPRDSADLHTLSTWAAAMRQALPDNPHVLRFSRNLERIEQLQRLQALQTERTRQQKKA